MIIKTIAVDAKTKINIDVIVSNIKLAIASRIKKRHNTSANLSVSFAIYW